MSLIWDKLIGLSNQIDNILSNQSEIIFEDGLERFNKTNWVNRVYGNENFRRAHIDIVDVKEKKGLWMMHCCIFPHLHNCSPIFGYDVVAGENKITGFFHDFSPVQDKNHPMCEYFSESAKTLNWNKIRPIPDWGKEIFSDSIMAIGNIKEKHEIDNLDVVIKHVNYFISNVGKYNHTTKNCAREHNLYAYYQKQNIHTPKTMRALGLEEEDVELFIDKCLFPEVS